MPYKKGRIVLTGQMKAALLMLHDANVPGWLTSTGSHPGTFGRPWINARTAHALEERRLVLITKPLTDLWTVHLKQAGRDEIKGRGLR